MRSINKLNSPLYRAIRKYGKDNFSFALIKIYKDYNPQILDKLEIYYISKYNSYKEGYNQTIGGDGGILGYKMTESQIEKIKYNSKLLDTKDHIFVKNIKTNEVIEFKNMILAAEFLKTTRTVISNYFRGLRKNNIVNG